MTTLPLYGFVYDQFGTEGYFTNTNPFFQSEDSIVYKDDKGEQARLQGDEARYVLKPSATAFGDLDSVVLVAGDDFLRKLSLVNISTNINTWNTETGFFWKLGTEEEYEQIQNTFRRDAATWLTQHLKSESEPVTEAVEAAISIIQNSGNTSKEDYVLTGLASKLIGDERSYQIQAIIVASNITDSLFDSQETYFDAVSKLEAELNSNQ